jgi:hypothetical protein
VALQALEAAILQHDFGHNGITLAADDGTLFGNLARQVHAELEWKNESEAINARDRSGAAPHDCRKARISKVAIVFSGTRLCCESFIVFSGARNLKLSHWNVWNK